MDEILKVALIGLAVWQVTEILHHSLLLLPVRRWANKNSSVGVLRAFFAKLALCAFCKSHWVAGALVILLALSLEGVPYCFWTKYIIWIFAATRLAQLGNDLCYDFTRSPKHDIEEENDVQIDDEPAADDAVANV